MTADSVAVGIHRSRSMRSEQAWERLLSDTASEMRSLLGHQQRIETLGGARSAIIVSGHFADQTWMSSEIDVMPTARHVVLRDGRKVTAHELLCSTEPQALGGGVAQIVAPFGCLVRDRGSEAIIASVDVLGMRHMYHGATSTFSIVSTSATLASRLLGSDIDLDAVAVFSQLGHFLGERSMFVGVRKLARGEVIRLTETDPEVVRTVNDLPRVVRRTGHFRSTEEAAERGTEILKRVMSDFAAAFPDAVLELSGGLDSRMVLAALPMQARQHLRTLTIGADSSDDMRVARHLVSTYELNGSFVPFSLVDEWDQAQMRHRIQRAAAARDFSSNPMASAIYDFVSEQVPAAAQLTGAAGEQARGRYYAGQRRRDGFDRDRVEQVVRWQLVLNQAVDTSLLAKDFQKRAAEQLRDQAWQLMEGVDGPWPQATDQIYMFARIQRWAGPAYSHWGLDRTVVAPFFHHDYVEWASRLPVEAKRNAAAFLDVLLALDRHLFEEPLANGLTPRQQRATGMRGRLQHGKRDLRRLLKKVNQRLGNRRHVPAGVSSLSRAMSASLRENPPAGIANLGFLDQRGLERFLEGDVELDAVSISFLINLEGAVRASTDKRQFR